MVVLLQGIGLPRWHLLVGDKNHGLGLVVVAGSLVRHRVEVDDRIGFHGLLVVGVVRVDLVGLVLLVMGFGLKCWTFVSTN